MPNLFKEKSIALITVLSTLLVVIILANILMNFILSQSRLTHHQVSRIRAYYAGLAGMNLAFEQLRTGNWTTGNYTLCRSGCNINDPDIPYEVNISISPPNTTGIRTINITTSYTYNP